MPQLIHMFKKKEKWHPGQMRDWCFLVDEASNQVIEVNKQVLDSVKKDSSVQKFMFIRQD